MDEQDARAQDAHLVEAVQAGDPDAFGALYDRWYDRLHDLARRITHDDGLAADVAQDTFLTAWQRLGDLRDPATFGGWLLRIARNRALDLVRSAERTRTTAAEPVTLAYDEAAAADRLGSVDDPATLAGDRELQELVSSAAAALGERDATALDLQLRHGLEPAEIGEVLGINRNAANQLVHRMKGRLEKAVRSRVLWRGGRPECTALQRALAQADIDAFTTRAVTIADQHADVCDDCGRRRETRLDPAKLFSAVPIAVAPVLLKQRTAAALEAAGVPMSGSEFASGGHGGPSRTRRRRVRHLAALAAVAALVLVLVGVLSASRLGDGALDGETEEATDVPTSTTDPGGMMVIIEDPEASLPDTGPGDREDPLGSGDATPGGGDGAPPSDPSGDPPPGPAPAAPSARISTSGQAPRVAPAGQFPTVTWSTANATGVSVSGPGLSSAAASGSQPVCPGTVVNGACRTNAGSYTYTVTATGPGGSVERSATLVVA